MQEEKQVKDLVCGMMVVPDSYPISYQGISYAFCSSQCRDRFESHPHLYVGAPGHLAPSNGAGRAQAKAIPGGWSAG